MKYSLPKQTNEEGTKGANKFVGTLPDIMKNVCDPASLSSCLNVKVPFDQPLSLQKEVAITKELITRDPLDCKQSLGR